MPASKDWVCRRCGGKKQLAPHRPCYGCDGSGRVTLQHALRQENSIFPPLFRDGKPAKAQAKQDALEILAFVATVATAVTLICAALYFN